MLVHDAHKRLSHARWVLYLLAGIFLTILLQGAARFLGPVGVFLSFVTPLPCALLQVLLGFPAGVISVGASALILSSGGDPASGIAYLLQFGILSLVLPLLLKKGYGWDKAAVGTLVVVISCVALFSGVLASSRGESILQLVSGYVTSEVDSAISLYSAADVPQEQIDEFRSIATKTTEFLLVAWPGLLSVFTGVLILLTTFLLSLFPGLKGSIPGVPFHRWKSPEYLVWGLIMSGFSVLIADGILYAIGLNLLTVLLSIYFLQGLAIMTFFFRKKGVKLIVRAFAYAIAVLLNPLPLVVTGLGVFDLWADFRKPRIKEQ